MELDFTIGLTEGISWPWPIAVYLFLAGICCTDAESLSASDAS